MKLLVYYPDEVESINAHIIDEDELPLWLEDGSIREGTLVYELPNAHKIGVLKKKMVLEEDK